MVGGWVVKNKESAHASRMGGVPSWRYLSPHTSVLTAAVCLLNLLVVILLSVLLKMDAAYIQRKQADGIDPEVAFALLVASNALVNADNWHSLVLSRSQPRQQLIGFCP